MPKNNKDFNKDFLKQLLQNEEDTAAQLAIISAVLISLGEGLSTLSAVLAFEGKKNENFDGTDATTLAIMGGSILAFGDIVGTIAAVRAIEEIQTLNKNQTSNNNASQNRLKQLERENQYLKAQLNRLRNQK